MTKGDMVEASKWFEQAVELYGTNKDRRNQVASAKTSLSNLYFHMKKFQDSQRVGSAFFVQSNLPVSFLTK